MSAHPSAPAQAATSLKVATGPSGDIGDEQVMAVLGSGGLAPYNAPTMRERPSARLLVLDPLDRVLLFKFEHKKGALAGQSFWATPGGGLDPGESYSQAARR